MDFYKKKFINEINFLIQKKNVTNLKNDQIAFLIMTYQK